MKQLCKWISDWMGVLVLGSAALIDVATAAQILASSTIPGFFETMCNAA